jgi:hypothetical protein
LHVIATNRPGKLSKLKFKVRPSVFPQIISELYGIGQVIYIRQPASAQRVTLDHGWVSGILLHCGTKIGVRIRLNA